MTIMETAGLLGNVGEFLGAIGVVVSLVYVAFQVRDNSKFVLENTKALLSTTEITSNDGNRELNLAYVQNPELVGLIVRGMDAEELNESDAPRFAQWIRMIFEAHMTYFVQHDRGLTGDEVWDYWSRVFDRYCRRPGVIQRWQRIRGDFDSKFRDYIDAKIEEKPE